MRRSNRRNTHRHGQTLVEYGSAVLLIAIVAVLALSALGVATGSVFNNISSTINSAIGGGGDNGPSPSGLSVGISDSTSYPDSSSASYDLSADISNGTAPFTYAWAGPGGFSSSDAAPTYVFACADLASGTEQVTLTVTDANNDTAGDALTLAACSDLSWSVTLTAGAPNSDGTVPLTARANQDVYNAGDYSLALMDSNGISFGIGYGTNEDPYAQVFNVSASGTYHAVVADWQGNVLATSNLVTVTIDCNLLATGCWTITLSAGTPNSDGSVPLTSVSNPAVGTSADGQHYSNSAIWRTDGTSIGYFSYDGTTNQATAINSGAYYASVRDTLTGSLLAISNLVTVTVPLSVKQISRSNPAYSGNNSLATYSFWATVIGGSGSFTYAWSGPSGFSDTNYHPYFTFNCSDLASGTASLSLIVADTADNSTATGTLPLAACPSPWSVTLTAGATNTDGTVPLTALANQDIYDSGYDLVLMNDAGIFFGYGWASYESNDTQVFNVSVSGTYHAVVSDSLGNNIQAASDPVTVTVDCSLLTTGCLTVTISAGAPNADGSVPLTATSSQAVGDSTYLYITTGGSTIKDCWSGTTCEVTASNSGTYYALVGDYGDNVLAISDPLTVTIPLAVSAHSSSPYYSGDDSLANYSFWADVTSGSDSLSYAWSGPSGFVSSDSYPYYPFNCSDLASGTASVSLTVTDPDSHTATATLPLAACPIPWTVTLTAGTPSGDGTVVPLTATSNQAVYNNPDYPWDYLILLNDSGQQIDLSQGAADSPNSHVFNVTVSGTYHAIVGMGGRYGLATSDSVTVHISLPAPAPSDYTVGIRIGPIGSFMLSDDPNALHAWTNLPVPAGDYIEIIDATTGGLIMSCGPENYITDFAFVQCSSTEAGLRADPSSSDFYYAIVAHLDRSDMLAISDLISFNNTWAISLAAGAPSNGMVTLTSTSNYTLGPTPYFADILTADGTVLKSCNTGDTCSVDVSNAAAGTYYAIVGNSTGTSQMAISNSVFVNGSGLPDPTTGATETRLTDNCATDSHGLGGYIIRAAPRMTALKVGSISYGTLAAGGISLTVYTGTVTGGDWGSYCTGSYWDGVGYVANSGSNTGTGNQWYQIAAGPWTGDYIFAGALVDAVEP